MYKVHKTIVCLILCLNLQINKHLHFYLSYINVTYIPSYIQSVNSLKWVNYRLYKAEYLKGMCVFPFIPFGTMKQTWLSAKAFCYLPEHHKYLTIPTSKGTPGQGCFACCLTRSWESWRSWEVQPHQVARGTKSLCLYVWNLAGLFSRPGISARAAVCAFFSA